MKGFIIMATIFALMFVLILSEEYYIRKISEEMSFYINQQDIYSKSNFENFINNWENNKSFLKLVLCGDDVENISVNIRVAEHHLTYEKYHMFMERIVIIRSMIENLPNY